MKRCSGCQRVHYCSRECQRDDWDEHRLECTAMQEQLQEQQLKAALNRLIKGGPLPSLGEPAHAAEVSLPLMSGEGPHEDACLHLVEWPQACF